MPILKYAAAARQDLLEIWVSIALDNPAAADRVVDRVEAACAKLRAYPELGRARPEIGDGARALIIGHWLALYKVEPESVQIVRIVDGVSDLVEISWQPGKG